MSSMLNFISNKPDKSLITISAFVDHIKISNWEVKQNATRDSLEAFLGHGRHYYLNTTLLKGNKVYICIAMTNPPAARR